MKFEKRCRVFAAVAVIFILLSVILGVISLATIDKNEKRIAELEARNKVEDETVIKFKTLCLVMKGGETYYPTRKVGKHTETLYNTNSLVTIQGTQITIEIEDVEMGVKPITFDLTDPQYRLIFG